MGREYVFPYRGIGRHGYLSDIKALCWTYCLISCIFSCGIGQVFSLCGNVVCNFGAIYSCHARRKLRARYRLPPTFGLPPGMDDFLTHFLCFYCSSHQELREIAARGVDGPGLHILDVLPDSFARAPRGPEAAEARRTLRDHVLAHPPPVYRPAELRKAIEAGDLGFDWEEELLDGRVSAAQAIVANIIDETDNPQFGWLRYPPKPQIMTRGGPEGEGVAGSADGTLAGHPSAVGAVPGLGAPAGVSASALPHPATSADQDRLPSLRPAPSDLQGARSIELSAPTALAATGLGRSKARQATGAAFDVDASDDDLDSSVADASSSAPSSHAAAGLSDREKIERFLEKSKERPKGVAAWGHKGRAKARSDALAPVELSRAAAAAFAETASAAGVDLDAAGSGIALAGASDAGAGASSSRESLDVHRALAIASSQASTSETPAPSPSFTLPPSKAEPGRSTMDRTFDESLDKQKRNGPRHLEKKIERSITKLLDANLAKPIQQIAMHAASRIGTGAPVAAVAAASHGSSAAERSMDLRDESEPALPAGAETSALRGAGRDRSAPATLERGAFGVEDSAGGGSESSETRRDASRPGAADGQGDGSRTFSSRTAPSSVSAETAALRSGFENSQAPRPSVLVRGNEAPAQAQAETGPARVTFAPAPIVGGDGGDGAPTSRHAVATVTGPRSVPMWGPPGDEDGPARGVPAEALAHIAALPHLLTTPATVPISAEPRAGGPLQMQIIESSPTDAERKAESMRLATPDWDAMQLELEMNVEPRPLTRAWSIGY